VLGQELSAKPDAALARPLTSTRIDSRALRKELLSLSVLLALITYFWWPALWHGQVIVHIDAAHHSISLLSILRQALLDGRELLWDSHMYGGHPLFAESQGGFLNPLNLLCAYLFEPKYGIGVLRWLTMLLSAGGAYWLARCLAIRPCSALFASLAVVFSGAWIEFQYNLSVIAAMAWLTWLVASSEYWLTKPTLKRAVLMAVSAALLIFAGYPHMAYAAALYLGVRLLTPLLYRSSRQQLWDMRRPLLLQGGVALLLAGGLAAVQLLPMLELVSQSHRSAGVEMLFAGLIPLSSYLKSLLLFNSDPLHAKMYVGCLSSALCLLLASLVIFAKAPPRIVAHLLAGLLLLNVGMELQSPLFRLLYTHHLLPGLHSFRIMHPFMPAAVLGLAIAAAYSLDNLSLIIARIQHSRYLQLLAASMLLGTAALLIYLYDPLLSLFNQLEPLLFILLAGLALWLRQAHLIALLAVALYGAGVPLYKSQMFTFYEPSVLAAASTISSLQQDPELEQFKTTFEAQSSEFYALPSNHPDLAQHYRRYLSGLAPSPIAAMAINSIDGNLALPLALRIQAQGKILEEIAGHASNALGSRLIDVIGLKYIPLIAPSANPSFELYHHDQTNGIYLYRNLYAKPRFQLYGQAQWVDSSAEALAQLSQSPPGALLLVGPPQPAQPTCSAPQAASFVVLQASSMHYHVRLSTPCPTWLFLADANYPGWQAHLDEQATPLYSAQVLGKAVAVPAGEHLVRIDYVPRSFQIGLAISLLSLLVAAVLSWRGQPKETA
jgi:hypothetical protein